MVVGGVRVEQFLSVIALVVNVIEVAGFEIHRFENRIRHHARPMEEDDGKSFFLSQEIDVARKELC